MSLTFWNVNKIPQFIKVGHDLFLTFSLWCPTICNDLNILQWPICQAVDSLLDLCCGSGVQGIVALRYYASSASFVARGPEGCRGWPFQEMRIYSAFKIFKYLIILKSNIIGLLVCFKAEWDSWGPLAQGPESSFPTVRALQLGFELPGAQGAWTCCFQMFLGS